MKTTANPAQFYHYIFLSAPSKRVDASPYMRAAMFYTSMLQENGFAVYLPHLWFFQYIQYPRPRDFWLKQDLVFLANASAVVHVGTVSLGVKAEKDFAETWSVPWFDGIEQFLTSDLAESLKMDKDELHSYLEPIDKRGPVYE